MAARHSFTSTAIHVRRKLNPGSLSVSISAFSPAGPTCRSGGNSSSSIPDQGPGGSITNKCRFYMSHGLDPSTRRVYSTAQRRFTDFCIQDNQVKPNGSILRASQETLIRFCSHLADRLHHTSIKVYLSGIPLSPY